MMEQLNLKPSSRVLEIGAGTGYNAAILAQIVGETGSVTTMDIDQDIVDEAAENLYMAGYSRVKAVCADGFNGYPEGQPYDRITVTVGAYDVSPQWIQQLKENGVMVVPLWFKGYCLCVAFEKHDGELRGLSAIPCLFIPIRGARQPTEGYFPIGEPPDEYLQMTIGLERDDLAYRRDLRNLFSQDACALPDDPLKANFTLRTCSPACSCPSPLTRGSSTCIRHPRATSSRDSATR